MLKKIILLLLISLSIHAQTSTYSPTIPNANEIVTITYNPFNDSAKFSINEEVYAIIWHIDNMGEAFLTNEKLKVNNNLLVGQITIDDNAAYYIIRFITLSQNAWDVQADLDFMIYRSDNNPTRNARFLNMNSQNYEKETEAELNLYPNNYAILARLWDYEREKKPDRFDSIITEGLLSLNQINESTVELLYAKAQGNILLHNYEQSFLIAQELTQKYPKSNYTASVLSFFLYELEKSNDNNEIIDKLKQLTELYALKNKEQPEVWDFIARLSSSVFSDTCIQKVCEHWLLLQPDNPSPYFFAGLANKNLDEFSKAEEYFNKAITLILEGKLRLYSDSDGKYSNSYLTSSYYSLADIRFANNNYIDALEALKLSQSLADNPFHKLYQLEGDIWFKLKNYNLAEKAYIEALKRGLPDGKKNIQKCYERTHNSSEGFENYLSAKLNTTIDDKSNNENKAPFFDIVDINNVDYSLDKLRGKVIVMNYWSTGCLPCKQEIPLLNELVKKYKGADVVFLGLAQDSDLKVLHKFLSNYPFSYEIVPRASQIAEDYKVTLLPTHIIIDKKGDIVATFAGGGEKIDEELSNVIDILLEN